MLKIGCHLSISGGYTAAAKTIKSIGGNTFQFFSRNPRGGTKRAFDKADVDAFNLYAAENQISAPLAHAPYTLNAASADPNIRDFALRCMQEDLLELEFLDNVMYNFHPGSHTGQGVDVGIGHIVNILNQSLKPEQKTIVLLETMSGKGSEIGHNFEELKSIIDGTNHSEKLGICMDTCHIFSGGYDLVNDLDGVLENFDKILGIGKLKAIHLNDSMMPYMSNKDRHEKIGQGTLGLKTFENIINHKYLKDIPFYLETPNELDGYKSEIELLKSLYKN